MIYNVIPISNDVIRVRVEEYVSSPVRDTKRICTDINNRYTTDDVTFTNDDNNSTSTAGMHGNETESELSSGCGEKIAIPFDRKYSSINITDESGMVLETSYNKDDTSIAISTSFDDNAFITKYTNYITAIHQSTTDCERKDIMHSATIDNTESLTCNTGICNGSLGYIASDQIDMVFVMDIFADYDTHWSVSCIDWEQAALPIDGKYTTVGYSWHIMLVRVTKGYTSTSIRSGNTCYILIISHATTNKHTDGIVIGKVAHGNQVSKPFTIRGDAFASYVLSFGNNNAYKLLGRQEVREDNTHAECDTARLIVEFDKVSMHNISPTRWDGRGVSADRFKVQSEYASNLDELERYL